mgnify:CR=1 FL=1
MIIYVARPDDAERVKNLLCDNGIRNTRTYTGLTNNDIREQLLKEWKANKFEIMIATSAFGVGVDSRMLELYYIFIFRKILMRIIRSLDVVDEINYHA